MQEKLNAAEGLASELENTKSRLGTLQLDMAEKDSKITELKQDAEEHKKAMDVAAEQHDIRVADLQMKLQKLENIRREVQKRDERIAELEAENSKIASIEAVLREKEGLISDMEEKSKDFEKLTLQLSAKSSRIAELEFQIRELERQPKEVRYHKSRRGKIDKK